MRKGRCKYQNEKSKVKKVESSLDGLEVNGEGGVNATLHSRVTNAGIIPNYIFGFLGHRYLELAKHDIEDDLCLDTT